MSILIQNLYKSFDGKPVLSNFSCQFPEKGVVALMGKSGIGKSTLIHLLLGLIAPDSGSISGADGLKFSAVFQDDRLLLHLNARQNLLLTTGCASEEIDAALTALSLNPSDKAPVITYSGGMKRRVALARGILFSADVLLLDEPFRGLDAETRGQAIELILKKWRNRLIVLVTHSMEEARRLGANQIIMIGENPDEI